MGNTSGLELLFLHALPLDGSMWARQMELLPGACVAPTLYDLGDGIEAWAATVLNRVQGDRLIVVGCSVGGSCAIEVARAAPDRVAALVLIGTKVRHRPEPELRIAALRTLREAGIEQAWRKYWVPLFSSTADAQTVAAAERIALAQPPEALARGITAFHTRPSRDNFLATFPRPILFVTGADDVAPGPETSAAQTAAVPQGSLHVVPDCGHYVPLERPEALNAILYKLVADTAGCFENDQKATAY